MPLFEKKISLPKYLVDFANVFYEHGFKCYFVGGAIRDKLLGIDVNDWDAASDAKPEDIKKMFRNVIPTGILHGTVTVKWQKNFIETTTFRLDGKYSDGRHPESIEYTQDINEDLSRRDFTINGMALDPISGEVLDPFDGKSDLQNKIIRAIGDAEKRFDEDGLRTLRAIRFASKLGFSIEEKTFAAIPKSINKFKMVSYERIREEFSKILISDNPRFGLNMLYECGLMKEFLPELAMCKGNQQGDHHKYDVFDHLLATCEASPKDLILRLASLFHDIAKPECRAIDPEKGITYYGHDMKSAFLCEKILRRLKYSNDIIQMVKHLIKNHMFNYTDDWTDGAVRRFVSRVGIDNVKDLTLLRLADTTGMGFGVADPRSVLPLIERVENFIKQNQAFTLKQLAVNGEDLASIGIPKGKVMGQILNELLESVLDDAKLNTKESLLSIATKIKSKYGVL